MCEELEVSGVAVAGGHNASDGVGVPAHTGATCGLDDGIRGVVIGEGERERFEGEEAIRVGHPGFTKRFGCVGKTRAGEDHDSLRVVDIESVQRCRKQGKVGGRGDLELVDRDE